MSSHAAALMALSRALGPGLEALDLSFIRAHAANVLAASPVDYISGAKLRGSLFVAEAGGTDAGGPHDKGDVRNDGDAQDDGGSQDRGSVQEECDKKDGSVCVADSGFWVDHTEPVAVLASI